MIYLIDWNFGCGIPFTLNFRFSIIVVSLFLCICVGCFLWLRPIIDCRGSFSYWRLSPIVDWASSIGSFMIKLLDFLSLLLLYGLIYCSAFMFVIMWVIYTG